MTVPWSSHDELPDGSPLCWGGRPEAEATFRGQLVIIRIEGRHTILGGCCTWCMLYLVYAVLGVCCTRCMLVLGVNSSSRHGEIERDDFTLCSVMMVELWTTKREIDNDEENDVENTCKHEKSVVGLPLLGQEDIVLV